MEVAINNALKGKDFAQVQELLIDGTLHNIVDNTYFSDETKRLLEQCVELESLSIVNWRLVSLKNFPHLPKLKKLVLSHNSLRDGLQHLLEAKLNLFFLNLTHNLISKVSELVCLGLFANLQTLELVGCSVCKAPDFSKTIFRIIPSLKNLDYIYTLNGETDDADPFNTYLLHTNNNNHHTANNNGINGTVRPPPQHGKLYNMSVLLKDYNENFASYYSSSNSYGPHEFSTSDLEQMLTDIQPAIPHAPPPPSSPKVREVPNTPPAPSRGAADTESTDDEEEHSYDDEHDEDIETLERVANQMLRKERPTRRAAEPQSRAAYQARQIELAQLDDDEDEEEDDDFRPGEEDSDRSGQSEEEPAQDERDAPEGNNESDDEDQEEEDEDEDEEEEEGGSPSATSQVSGASSSSKRERETNEGEDDETQPKKQR